MSKCFGKLDGLRNGSVVFRVGLGEQPRLPSHPFHARAVAFCQQGLELGAEQGNGLALSRLGGGSGGRCGTVLAIQASRQAFDDRRQLRLRAADAQERAKQGRFLSYRGYPLELISRLLRGNGSAD